MAMDDYDRQKRRTFQWVKSLSVEKFWEWMNWLHSQAYAKAVQHYTEAAEIVLPPRLQKQLHDKATEIRETWDGMATISLDDTTGKEFDDVLGRLRGDGATHSTTSIDTHKQACQQ